MELKRTTDKQGGMLRQYIPGLLQDNEILMREDPNYIHRLDALPEPYRTAYKDGRWDIFLGQAFNLSMEHHVIEPIPVPDNAQIYMTFDWGFGAPFSFGWWWVDADGRLYRFAEWYGWNQEPNKGLRLEDSRLAEGVVEIERKRNIESVTARYAGHDCFNKKPDYKGGGQGKPTSEVFSERGLYLTKGDATRHLKIRQFRERLKIIPGERPMIQIYSTCEQFIRTIPMIQTDSKNPEEIDSTGEDHIFDETCHICMARPMNLQIPKSLKSLANRRLDMLESGVQTPSDEYEQNLTQHVADQEQWAYGVDYENMAPGETIGTIEDY